MPGTETLLGSAASEQLCRWSPPCVPAPAPFTRQRRPCRRARQLEVTAAVAPERLASANGASAQAGSGGAAFIRYLFDLLRRCELMDECKSCARLQARLRAVLGRWLRWSGPPQTSFCGSWYLLAAQGCKSWSFCMSNIARWTSVATVD